MAYPFFYNSIEVDGVKDRPYDADSFSDWLKKFFTTGVFNGELRVTASGGMGISVASGYCNINGKVMMFDTTPLTVGTADSQYYRIDSVIIERNDTQRNFFVKIVQGSVGAESSVTGVTPVRSGGVYQLVLARIKVKPGATSITQADITDTRSNKSLCGIVAGTVTQMDFTQFSAQFDAYLEAFKTEQQAEFETWFEGLQDVLDEDTAGHLQNEIDDLTTISNQHVFKATPEYTISNTSDDTALSSALSTVGWSSLISSAKIGMKKLLTAIVSRFTVTQILASTTRRPTTTGWTPTYISVPHLGEYDTVYVRCLVYGRIEFLTFLRASGTDSYSLTCTDTYYSNGTYTYGRMSVTCDWGNNRVGLSTINGEKSQMGIQGVWGTNKR